MLVERNDAAAFTTVMLLPVLDVFLNQVLVETNDTLEEIDGLLTIVNFCGSDLINRLVIGLELACLEERNRILDE